MTEDDTTGALERASETLRDNPIGFHSVLDEFHFRLALAALLRQTAIQFAARGINERAKRPLTAVESLTHVAAQLTRTANDLQVLEDSDGETNYLTRDEAVIVFTKALATLPGAEAAELDPTLAVQL